MKRATVALLIFVAALAPVAHANPCSGIFAQGVAQEEAPGFLKRLAGTPGKVLLATAVGYVVAYLPHIMTTVHLASGGTFGGGNGGGGSEHRIVSAQENLGTTLRAIARSGELSSSESAALGRLADALQGAESPLFVDPLDNPHLFGDDLALAPVLVGGGPAMPLVVNSRAINDPARFEGGVISYGAATALLVEALGRDEPALGSAARERLARLAQAQFTSLAEPYGRATLEILALADGSTQVAFVALDGEATAITPLVLEALRARTRDLSIERVQLRELKWVPALGGPSFRAELTSSGGARGWAGAALVRIEDGAAPLIQLERLRF